MIKFTGWTVRPYNPAYPNETFVNVPNGYIEIGGSNGLRKQAPYLIASAPELLEVCKMWLDRAENKPKDSFNPIEITRAIIAKAEGRKA